jgi:hypothetical protein
MSKHQIDNVTTVILAASTSMAVGTFLLQALGAFVLGVMGALAGWFFTSYIRPRLDTWKAAREAKKNAPKA